MVFNKCTFLLFHNNTTVKLCAVAYMQNIPFTSTKVDVANWLQQLQSEWKFTGVVKTGKKEKKTTSTNLIRLWLLHWPILHAKFYIVYFICQDARLDLLIQCPRSKLVYTGTGTSHDPSTVQVNGVTLI